MVDRPDWHITDGTSQQARWPHALQPGSVAVDEMSFADLLSLTSELAAGLQWFNLRNEPEGTWSDILSADEAVIMAHIARTDLGRLETDYLRHRTAPLEDLVVYTCHLANLLDQWYRALAHQAHDPGKSLSWKIAELIHHPLLKDLHNVGEWLNRTCQEHRKPLPVDFERFHPIWGIDNVRGVSIFSKAELPEERRAEGDRRILGSALNAFTHAVAALQSQATETLQQSLRHAFHPPSVGLLMTFLQLFRHAQHALNTLPDRHLEFYYHRVLGAAPRPAKPDHAFLVLEKDPGAPDVLIPKGTEFSAGQDEDKQERVYRADMDVLVTSAKIADLRTLFFERDSLISPERELDFRTRAEATRIPTRRPTDPADQDETWPLFGQSERSAHHNRMDQAELGFAVASPILELQEGQREIQASIQLAEPLDSDEIIAQYLQALAHQQIDELEALRLIIERYRETRADLFEEIPEHLLPAFAERLLPQFTGLLSRVGRPSEQQEECYNFVLLDLVRQSQTERGFFRLFGQILARSLLIHPTWLKEDERQTILSSSRDRLSEVSVGVIENLLSRDRQALCSTLLQHAFTVGLTAEHGWYEPPDAILHLSSEEDGSPQAVVKCTITLQPGIPPIVPYHAEVHGGRWESQHPILTFRLNPGAQVYPYSLFHRLVLRALTIEVTANGVSAVVAQNHQGQLDPTKPFQPFGVLPTTHSFVILGNAEIAKKPLTSLSIDLEWGELPTDPEGFRGYYRRYGPAFTNDSFQVEISVYRDGEWHPTHQERPRRQPLFSTVPDGDRLSAHTRLQVDALPYFKPLAPRTTAETFGLHGRLENGLVRLTLAAPNEAFGHKLYPDLLTRVLSANARAKHPQPVPPPPYTPLVTNLTFRYRARTLISLRNETKSPHETTDHIYHLHPFGWERIYPTGQSQAPSLLPSYPHDGNLFIGIEAPRIGGLLTVLFSLQEQSVRNPAAVHPRVSWAYLVGNHWRELSHARILADSTGGLLTSGIVTLDLPNDLDRRHTILPDHRVWLRVAADGPLQAFGRLRAIYLHGVQVTRKLEGPSVTHLQRPLPAGRIRRTISSFPGLRKVSQIADSRGGVVPETRSQLITRMSERLRHKHRAATPWDYERLILEHFPQVYKVKCFPAMRINVPGPQPGHVLIVVVPMFTEREQGGTFAPRFTVQELTMIGDTIRSLASPFVRIEVRNPAYELIQVRCTLKLAQGCHHGYVLSSVNRAIVQYISPWHEGGYQARFGWHIRREDIESVIRRVPEVEFVTGFSMLHLTTDLEGRYALADSARTVVLDNRAAKEAFIERPPVQSAQGPAAGLLEITPRYPWSLAIPMKTHHLELLDHLRPLKPHPVGIRDLQLEHTFIIS